jgi:hypothetical protein
LTTLVKPLVAVVDVLSADQVDIRNSLTMLAWNFSLIGRWYA